MIDIHCHIVPDVDDGSRSIEESLEIIRGEVGGGTTAFIATPHVIEKRDYDRLPLMRDRFDELASAAKSAQIPVDLYLGGEIYPTTNVLDALDRDLPVTLAGRKRHMLVDLPMGPLPNDFESLLYEIQLRGVTPIIAHPERCATFQMTPEALAPLLEKGCACQVNGGSLYGKYGPRATEVARIYLGRRMASFLSTDVHRPPKTPTFEASVKAAEPLVDAAYLELLTIGSARAVLAGEELPKRPSPPAEPEKKAWFSRFLKR